MAPKPIPWAMYGKMIAAFAVCTIGGPALVYYVQPTEEELFLKYNPELQKRSLENRQGKQEDFDNFVTRLKQYSKTNRPIWDEAALDETRLREGRIAEKTRLMEEYQARKKGIQKAEIKDVPSGSL